MIFFETERSESRSKGVWTRGMGRGGKGLGFFVCDGLFVFTPRERHWIKIGTLIIIRIILVDLASNVEAENELASKLTNTQNACYAPSTLMRFRLKTHKYWCAFAYYPH